MSKVDAQRAMREAKYAALTARPAPTAAPPARVVAAPPPDEPLDGPVVVEAAPVASGLCGHRNIGNRSCSRRAGHEEKSHRYA